jgi:hypothetical protein
MIFVWFCLSQKNLFSSLFQTAFGQMTSFAGVQGEGDMVQKGTTDCFNICDEWLFGIMN